MTRLSLQAGDSMTLLNVHLRTLRKTLTGETSLNLSPFQLHHNSGVFFQREHLNSSIKTDECGISLFSLGDFCCCSLHSIDCREMNCSISRIWCSQKRQRVIFHYTLTESKSGLPHWVFRCDRELQPILAVWHIFELFHAKYYTPVGLSPTLPVYLRETCTWVIRVLLRT